MEERRIINRLWQNAPCFDPETRREAKRIAKHEAELLSCFGTELSFGTGGLRGVLGVGTSRMNRYTVAKATFGLCGYLKQAPAECDLKARPASVAIAYDTRHGSREFAGVTAGVLARHGIRAWMYDRPMPTPLLSFAARALRCDAGVMITASHNPPQYNGYKVYGPDGCQITDEAAKAITAEIQRVDYRELEWAAEDEAKQNGLLHAIPPSVYEDYLRRTLACRVRTSPSKRAHPPLELIYTPLHGVGLEPVLDVLGRMPGIRVTTVEEQCAPDGDFPSCPDPNPERLPVLRLAIAYAGRTGSPLVLATDPDCDRVGVAARLPGGDYRHLTGNEVGLLLEEFILSNAYASRTAERFPSTVVKTVVTSDLAFPIAEKYGARVVEVLTGFKYIGEVISRMEADGDVRRFAFGFEESCGYLAGSHVRDKDGVMACMLVAEMAQALAAEGKTLIDALESLYRAHGFMETRLLHYEFKNALPLEDMAAFMTRLRADPPCVLGGSPVVSLQDYRGGIGSLPPSDVLSIQNEAGGKAVVRPSGTEPKVKIYLSAPGKSAEDALKSIETIAIQAEGWFAG